MVKLFGFIITAQHFITSFLQVKKYSFAMMLIKINVLVSQCLQCTYDGMKISSTMINTNNFHFY